MLHAFISVAPWFLFFVVIERLGEAQLAVSNIIRSVSTIFFVIVNSFAATTGALVSNLIGAGERQYLFPLCRKILKLGYNHEKKKPRSNTDKGMEHTPYGEVP